MTELVLDASVVLKWFASRAERGRAEALKLRRQYLAGDVRVVVPSLLFWEVLNVAGRGWGWDHSEVAGLASALRDLLFEVAEPEVGSVAAWVGRGLTAYDAVYVALAAGRRVPLVTDDLTVCEIARNVAQPLVRPA